MKQSFLSSALSMLGRGKKEEKGAAVDTPKETKVYFEEGGAKYHTNAHCSGMRKPQYIPLSVAKKRGLSPCKKCAPYGVAPTVRPAPTAPLFASATTSETKPAFGAYVNGDQIGNIPAEQADYVNANFSRLDGIVNIEVYGGGDGQNYGAEITLRFRNE